MPPSLIRSLVPKLRLKQLVLAGVIAFTGAAEGGDAKPIVLEALAPVVQLSDGDIALCGVRGEADFGAARIAVEVAIRKAPGDADRSEFRISAAPTSGKTTVAITGLSVRTAGLAPTEAFKSERDVSGALTLTGALPPTDGAMFMQQLLVGGGTATLAINGDPASIDIAIPGPAPQSVRAAYLNCAGDLFRP